MAKKKKVWRPRLYEGRVSITREGKLFAVACRTWREAAAVEVALIKTMAKIRRSRKRK